MVAAGGGNGSIFLLVGLFAVLYLVLIRPQRAKQRRQQQLLSSVEPGDEVLTAGGIYGIVQSVDEEGDLIVEIAEGIHVRLARRSVATVVKPDDEEEEDSEDEHAEPTGEAPTVTVPDDAASLEATQKRLFRRRN